MLTLPAQQIVVSADNLYKLFGSRSGPPEYRSWSGSKLFDTQIVFKKVNFWKKLIADNNVDQDRECRSRSGSKLCDTQIVYKKSKFLKKS